jgi:hypothetical protein
MGVQLLSIKGSQVKIEVTIDLSRSMLTSEENIQNNINEVGQMATKAALKYLDTDGSPIEIAGKVMRTKGENLKLIKSLMDKGCDLNSIVERQENHID